ASICPEAGLEGAAKWMIRGTLAACCNSVCNDCWSTLSSTQDCSDPPWPADCDGICDRSIPSRECAGVESRWGVLSGCCVIILFFSDIAHGFTIQSSGRVTQP